MVDFMVANFYVYDLSGYKNQTFYMASAVIVFLLLTLLSLTVIVNLDPPD